MRASRREAGTLSRPHLRAVSVAAARSEHRRAEPDVVVAAEQPEPSQRRANAHKLQPRHALGIRHRACGLAYHSRSAPASASRLKTSRCPPRAAAIADVLQRRCRATAESARQW
jgi:hypothetical protein